MRLTRPDIPHRQTHRRYEFHRQRLSIMPDPIYIKDLIKIPEHVGKGDFVLRLAEGVTDPEGTVKQYEGTPQLVKCFDQALKLVKSAIEGSSSKAAYLHGSFGSGKSHFMAILYLLLQGDSYARS